MSNKLKEKLERIKNLVDYTLENFDKLLKEEEKEKTPEPEPTPEPEEEKKKKNFEINYPFKGNFKITQNFGENLELYKNNGFAGHFGIDYATPWGSEILACDKGKISRAEFSAGNGNFIEITHEWGKSLYCHLKDLPTQNVGQEIAELEVIGHAGNTGLVYSRLPKNTPHRGTHLHFSIKDNEIKNPEYKDWVDPTDYFKK